MHSRCLLVAEHDRPAIDFFERVRAALVPI